MVAALESRLARLSVDQLHEMVAHGILGDREPVELIDGLLLHKDRSDTGGDPLTIGRLHNLVVQLLAQMAPQLLPLGFHLQTQGPLSLPPRDEPEPDGCLLRGSPRDYTDRLPGAADTTCVIEVAHSSLEHDRTVKLPLYARSRIAQYVIVNLRESVVEVYTTPESDGYRHKAVLTRGDQLDLRLNDAATFPVSVANLLP